MNIQKRAIIKWTAPIIASTILPAHAQASMCLAGELGTVEAGAECTIIRLDSGTVIEAGSEDMIGSRVRIEYTEIPDSISSCQQGLAVEVSCIEVIE